MRAFGIWVLFFVAISTFSCCCSRDTGSDLTPASYEDVPPPNWRGTIATITNRRLKISLLLERSYSIGTAKNKRGLGDVYMADYPRFDPTPSSKASIKAGPIEHGTPLMPYVPRPMPPPRARHGSP